jgi:hypothetical protein
MSAPRKKVRAVTFGDSITYGSTYGVLSCEYWTHRTQELLKDHLGVNNTQFRNLGVTGNTSTTMLARMHSAFQWRDGGTDMAPEWNVPDIGMIMIGVNDAGAAISTATTQANIESAIRCLLNRVLGVVADETALPVRDTADTIIPLGTRYWVLADGSTTGGVADSAVPSFMTQPARVAGAIAAVKPAGATTNGAVWIKRFHLAGTAGWARIADDPTQGCKQVWVLSTQFLPTETPGSPNATYAELRVVQAAAVTAVQTGLGASSTKVKFFNHWTLFAADVTSGLIPDMNSFVHTPGNQHYNAEGYAHLSSKLLTELIATNVPGETPSITWPNYWLAINDGD